ncbi:MAG: discoidin domain-containing protein, partial [Planctomycetes bacterium]|nr:discoidin domain-containing protein [Planctomycetota bacterium]
MRFHGRIAFALAAMTPAFGSAPRPADPPAAAAQTFREQVEADWLLQETFRHAVPPAAAAGAIATADDAAGGCDGVKDGTYGFHTGSSPSPWWQVDLGASAEIARIVVWNRCDGASERALRLQVRLSGDGTAWRTAYTHDGTPFGGVPDGKPLEVKLSGARARFVRIEAPRANYLHLDEVEVFGAGDPAKNLALGKPADQVSTSQWSRRAPPAAAAAPDIDWARRVKEILANCRRLAARLCEAGADTGRDADPVERIEARIRGMRDDEIGKDLYIETRWIQRRLLLADSLLDFDSILFLKRVPGSFNHMSDQHLGWWSLPGGGIHILRGFKTDAPDVECISGAFGEPGSFQTPCLSYDATRLLFAWCKYYPKLAGERNKLDKGNVPEDAFYHVFEVGIDGSGLRRLTYGKYDDFDPKYLPGGRIVFLSTRRGQSLQCGPETARASLTRTDGPDIYVRCGGGPERPCVVYTLHTMGPDGMGGVGMGADGGDLCAISPFEMFEWTPSVADDGRILYSRWDYIDRHNMPFMSLWSVHPDGTNARLVYGNFTRNLHCTFEPRTIPGSRKIIFTASAHHAQTMGSLVLLDPMAGDEGEGPITRLTPEVAFPEAESWPRTYYANPWPLSERLYLVAWGIDGARVQGPAGWARWHAVKMPRNGKALYLLDAAGSMELLHRDPEISCTNPIPLAPRARPQV